MNHTSRNRRFPVFVLAGFSLLVFPHSGTGPVRAAENGSLSGDWRLNVQESEDPRQKMMEARRRAAGSNGGQAEGFGDDGGDSRLGGGAPSGAGQGGGAGRPQSGPGASGQRGVAGGGAAPTLRVEERGGLVALVYPDGRRREFTMDGSGEMTAKWKKDQLTLSQKTPGGGKLVHRLSVDRAGRLVVSTTTPPRQQQPGVTYKQIYERVE